MLKRNRSLKDVETHRSGSDSGDGSGGVSQIEQHEPPEESHELKKEETLSLHVFS